MKPTRNAAISSFLVTILFCTTVSVHAQSCGCDFTVGLSTTVVDNNIENIAPGSTICITSGVRNHGIRDELIFKNFRTDNPSLRFVFKNCGGQVIFQSTHTDGNGAPDGTALFFDNCKNFRVTGTGDPSIEYGILVDGTSISGVGYTPKWGMKCDGKSTDFEIDHVKVERVDFAGFSLKPIQVVQTNRPGEKISP